MAKVRVHMRVAEYNPLEYGVVASTKPNINPMSRNGVSVPTAMFALDLDIPNSRFRMAEQVLAEVKVAESTGVTGVSVEYVDE